MTDHIYKSLNGHATTISSGVSHSAQFSVRLSEKIFTRCDFKLAGFICPFYNIDESKLELGYTEAITGIGMGNIEKYPRYKKKFDKFLSLASKIQELLQGNLNISLEIIMGDKGLINKKRLSNKSGDLVEIISSNINAYEDYFRENYHNLLTQNVSFSKISDFIGHYPVVGATGSDLIDDGKLLTGGEIEFDMNREVSNIVTHEQDQAREKNISIYESMGFALNYGLAGMMLRSKNTDILIGTDAPESYLNHLYHAFIDPKDLLIFVPK